MLFHFFSEKSTLTHMIFMNGIPRYRFFSYFSSLFFASVFFMHFLDMLFRVIAVVVVVFALTLAHLAIFWLLLFYFEFVVDIVARLLPVVFIVGQYFEMSFYLLRIHTRARITGFAFIFMGFHSFFGWYFFHFFHLFPPGSGWHTIKCNRFSRWRFSFTFCSL